MTEVGRKLDTGDWKLLNVLAANMPSLVLTEFLAELASQVQPDQINMVACFWYLVKSYLLLYVLPYNGQVTFYKVPEIHGYV